MSSLVKDSGTGGSSLHGLEEWRWALESAELYEWDEIDATERCSPLAGWLAEVYTDDAVGRDESRLWAALEALEVARDAGASTFVSRDRFMEVLRALPVEE